MIKRGTLKNYCDDVQRLRTEGLTSEEISRKLGITENQIYSLIRTYKLPRVCYEPRNKGNDDKARGKLASIGFEYLGGYDGCESLVEVKCLKCGCVFKYGFHNLVGRSSRGKTSCPNCLDYESKSSQMLEEQQKTLERIKKKENAEIKKIQARFKSMLVYKHQCANCGKEFYAKQNVIYCDGKCARRMNDRKKFQKRNKRIVSKDHDTDISLEKLFKRDKGVCYLCGGKCDYKDYVVINGTIVCGDHYPSIEHIKPISKGGTDTWNNIKLAHRICNTLKGNSLYTPGG